jgi:release factor glutamine methyltransferase
MTIGEVLRRSAQHLEAKGSTTPRLDAELLLARALGLARIDLYMQIDRPLTPVELDEARQLVARRARREPLQYVLGEWGFRRLTLTVDARALIPRPETETLVERALVLVGRRDRPRVLDVGTGTGAVALAIADEHEGARVTAVDVSEEALALAAENVARTGIAVELLHHDLFQGLPAGPWELVVSNPPYVDVADLHALEPEVRDWEPHLALASAGAVDALVRAAPAVLSERGWLVLEVGDGQAAGVAASLEQLGYGQVRVTVDLAGRPRVVEGQV